MLRWRIAHGQDFPQPARFANALVETSLPGVIIYVLARHMEPQLVFGFWPPMLYFVFIVLSTLRLDFWLSLWTGSVAAVQQFGLAALAAAASIRAGGRPEETLVYHFSRSVMLMLAGIAAAIVARTLRQQFENSVAAAAARDRVTNLFGQHVSPVVVEQLLDADLQSEQRTVCVMFLDIRGFTAMTRTRSADETVTLLNDFFAEMIEIVDRNNGFINKFLGDGFLALFGAALADPGGGGQCVGRGARHAAGGRRLEPQPSRPGAQGRHRHPYRRGDHRLDRLAAAQGVHRDRRHGEPRRPARAAHQGDRRAAAAVRSGARCRRRERRGRSRAACRSAATTSRCGSGGCDDLVLRLRLEHESGAARRPAAEGAGGADGPAHRRPARRLAAGLQQDRALARGRGAGNIVEAPGETVHGTLNEMPEAGLEVLDIWEGVAGGHYERRTVPVVRADTGETVEAVVYVALKVGEGLRPTREYLGHLLAGRDLLPADYWERLNATPTLD